MPATEVLIATPAVRSIIREGKTHLSDNVIQTSAEAGMMTLDMSLAKLVSSGMIAYDVASAFANNPEDLRRLVRR
jgi:twitching motility protein PilT